MRLTVELRRLISEAIGRGVKKTWVAQVLGITRKTLYKWRKRRHRLKDRKRNKNEGKVTQKVESFILTLRNVFCWGCARIKQGLLSLPKFVLDSLKGLGLDIVRGIKLSRTAINEVLRKHGINGYKKKHDSWKFFRAKCPNELWQLDIKGPFTLQREKYYYVVCIDDYSRYLLTAKQLDHCPDIDEISRMLQSLVRKYKPKKILTDNNPFKAEWDEWCEKNKITSLHAHPYYPQDKGKVERTIRNIAEEFIYLLRRFPQWLCGKIENYRRWYNQKRYHYGINDTPYRLYT